ncbi:MAG: multidrug transporter, partial [Deltaproteobacteria bacterium]|nr:multidrug transporter [Deltaproteobacteria bacterium]
MKRDSFLILCILILLLGGCTMAPKYKRPAAPVPNQWPTGVAYEETKSAASAPTVSALLWREFFTDERLQKIIVIALNNNRDLRLAALNVE